MNILKNNYFTNHNAFSKETHAFDISLLANESRKKHF